MHFSSSVREPQICTGGRTSAASVVNKRQIKGSIKEIGSFHGGLRKGAGVSGHSTYGANHGFLGRSRFAQAHSGNLSLSLVASRAVMFLSSGMYMNSIVFEGSWSCEFVSHNGAPSSSLSSDVSKRSLCLCLAGYCKRRETLLD